MGRIAKRYAKWHIDLPLCNRLQLEEAGVPLDAILVSNVCTYDRVDDYFSARVWAWTLDASTQASSCDDGAG